MGADFAGGELVEREVGDQVGDVTFVLDLLKLLHYGNQNRKGGNGEQEEEHNLTRRLKRPFIIPII